MNELTAISPLLAGFKKVNVFAVPEGYFDSISATVMVVLKEENELIPNKFIADVPAGYFDQLASSILDKIKLTEPSLDEIRATSETLFTLQEKNVFEVPEGYFDTLPAIVSSRVHEAGENEISPLLLQLQTTNVFNVPPGYFEGLSKTIVQKLQHQPAIIKAMPARNNTWVKYAVAAMLTGALALGIYRYSNNSGSSTIVENSGTFASLDAAIVQGKSMNEKEFTEALGKLTESDIASYLEKNGDITDVAQLGKNIEESNLPTPDDYLLDENALENYLKEIDTKSLNN